MEFHTRTSDTSWMNWLAGMAVGALAMYVADPAEGRRRRALLQDKMSSYSLRTQKIVGSTMRDARNRMSGLQAEALRMISPQRAKPIDNHVLEARIRSRIARAMPQLAEIEVDADQGMVTLAGMIPSGEETALLAFVESIPGVEAVRLGTPMTSDEDSGAIPSFFSGRSPLWIAGAIGAGVLLWYGLTRRQPLGLVAAATGLGLMARSGDDLHDNTAESMESAGHAYEAQCSIDIQAAPDKVYDVWSRYENFPHFMSHVIEVRDLGNQHSHWVVQGPAGSEVEFDSVLTAAERPHRLAWQSAQGASVRNEGEVTLTPQAEGTRVTVRMSWQPPAGTLGQRIAVLTGADPQRALEEDLRRMKQFIERGLPSRGGGSSGRGAVLH